ncbi:MAG: DUF6691 family protein [Elstera sp.]
MRFLLNLSIGLIFGLGLMISGMSNPAKVLNFLDLAALPTGGWDASLALVLASAVAVGLIGFQTVQPWRKPLLAEAFSRPTATRLDRRIILGPAIFGIGWGLAGFCPGPALVALGTGSLSAAIFATAMLAGMSLGRTSFDTTRR